MGLTAAIFWVWWFIALVHVSAWLEQAFKDDLKRIRNPK